MLVLQGHCPLVLHNFLNAKVIILKPINLRPGKGSLAAKIQPKARVIYFPLVLRSPSAADLRSRGDGGVLKIAWPHRWEHDKNPESFFECLTRLKSDGFRFRVAVLGESFEEKPPVFDEFRYDYINMYNRLKGGPQVW